MARAWHARRYDFLVEHLSSGGGENDAAVEELQVRYDARVRQICHDGAGARIHLDDGAVVEADFVLVTCPLGVLKRSAAEGGVDFEPPLSPRKAGAIGRLGMGTENKVALRWAPEEAFWPLDEPYLQVRVRMAFTGMGM